MKRHRPLYHFISRTAYPVIIVLAFVLHWFFQGQLHLPIAISAVLSITLCAGLISLLERLMPYRKQWTPDGKEIATDALYLGFVQVLVPQAVTYVLSVWAVTFINEHGWGVTWLWPHQLPAWLQVVIMYVIGDFFRYWVHRMVHAVPLLWRLHAVHHSSRGLYWLNVARFHPIEKILQQLFDVGPFILMGISTEVLTLHFIFYAVDGFFQHCNIDLEMGPLNYVVSGPQLHHWHHSRVDRERDTNFGNHIIVYDLLFGTWFLPKGREVADVGLREKGYPNDFIRQQAAPFLHRGR
jgi:ornithine lipid hydroxylase